MDYPFHVTGHFLRMREDLPRLYNVYENQAKQTEDRNRQDNHSYSFLLAGEGVYRSGGDVLALHAPCVFRQSPRPHCIYGPDTQWWEFSVCYLLREEESLAKWGLVDLPPVIHLHESEGKAMRNLISVIRQTVDAVEKDNRFADVLDHLAMSLLKLVQSNPRRDAAVHHDPNDPIEKIRKILDDPCIATPNLDALATRHGLSPASFRRRWGEHYDLSPGHYHLKRRLKEAARMLMQTDRALAFIAAETGFNDVFYFSRCFRKHMGVSPSQYRKQSQALSEGRSIQ